MDEDTVGAERVEKEEQLFSMPHTEAGYVLARAWRLPVQIAEPILQHHNPDAATEAPVITAAVALASLMADLRHNKAPSYGNPFDSHQAVLKLLGLSREAAAGIFAETLAAFDARTS
jgi:HD-like signal output (HDOD) protein